jgi:hypothetical protein
MMIHLDPLLFALSDAALLLAAQLALNYIGLMHSLARI